MAIDRALGELTAGRGVTIWRLYRWQRDTMSLGANEAAQRTWNRCRITQEGTAIVRRPTGGRGVWHDHRDLTYAVTGPLASWGSLAAAYLAIHQLLARALGRVFDEPVTLAPPSARATLAPGACFDRALGGEVLVGGRKAVGSAQALFGPGLLQHGAIALADRSAALARFTLRPAETDDPSVASPGLASEPLAVAILAAWADAGATEISADEVAEAVAAAAPWQARFDDPEWTWRR
jgi:lipoate-protein ligase A